MIESGKVIAANTDLDSAQAFILSSTDFSLGVIVSASGDDCFTRIRQEVSSLWEEMLLTQESLPVKLENMGKNLQDRLSGLEDLQILLSAWKPNPEKSSQVLYLKSNGSHQAYLLRESQLIHLTSNENSGQLVSGYLEEGDGLLLVSSSLVNLMPPEQMTALAETDPANLEEEINPLVMNQERIEPVAAILVDYPKEHDQEEVVSTLPPESPHVIRSQSIDLSFIREKVLSYLKNPRIRLVLVTVLVLLTVAIAIKTISHRANAEKDAKFASYLTTAEDKYNQALSSKDTDTATAKNDLDEAKKDLSLAEALKPGDQAVKSLTDQIDANSDQILKVYSISSWSTFLDLNLVKPGLKASGMTYSVGSLLLSDTNQRSLVEVDLKTKKSQILAGSEQLGNLAKASLNGNFAFSYSADKGVVRVDTKSTQATTAVKSDSDWGKIEDIVGFGGNIYLLDSIKNQIWKYTPAASGYSDKTNYLKGNNGVDFSAVKKMLIDSSVYILKSPAEIDRYTAGVSDNFSVGGLDKNINNIITFFVSSDTDNFYLIDSDNSRMLILKKDGVYVSQIHSDEFKKATDLVVSEGDKKIYLLEGDKIVTASMP